MCRSGPSWTTGSFPAGLQIKPKDRDFPGIFSSSPRDSQETNDMGSGRVRSLHFVQDVTDTLLLVVVRPSGPSPSAPSALSGSCVVRTSSRTPHGRRPSGVVLGHYHSLDETQKVSTVFRSRGGDPGRPVMGD